MVWSGSHTGLRHCNPAPSRTTPWCGPVWEPDHSGNPGGTPGSHTVGAGLSGVPVWDHSGVVRCGSPQWCGPVWEPG